MAIKYLIFMKGFCCYFFVIAWHSDVIIFDCKHNKWSLWSCKSKDDHREINNTSACVAVMPGRVSQLIDILVDSKKKILWRSWPIRVKILTTPIILFLYLWTTHTKKILYVAKYLLVCVWKLSLIAIPPLTWNITLL